MRRFGGMTRSERFAASTQQISPLPIPLPLQNEVVDERRLLTVPWVSLFQWILNIGTRTFVTGTHADRIDEKNDPAQYRPGTWFWETDRTVLYQVRIVADEPHWVYVLGTMEAPLASRPTDLGPYDAGFQFAATDTGQLYLWDGTAWVEVPAETGDIQIAYGSTVVVLTGTPQDLPGLSLTLNRAGRYHITGVYDFRGDAGDALLIGQLLADGAVQPKLGFLGAPAQGTVTQQWVYTATAPGKVVKLRAYKNTGTGSSIASGESTLTALWVSA